MFCFVALSRNLGQDLKAGSMELLDQQPKKVQVHVHTCTYVHVHIYLFSVHASKPCALYPIITLIRIITLDLQFICKSEVLSYSKLHVLL